MPAFFAGLLLAGFAAFFGEAAFFLGEAAPFFGAFNGVFGPFGVLVAET